MIATNRYVSIEYSLYIFHLEPIYKQLIFYDSILRISQLSNKIVLIDTDLLDYI